MVSTALLEYADILPETAHTVVSDTKNDSEHEDEEAHENVESHRILLVSVVDRACGDYSVLVPLG